MKWYVSLVHRGNQMGRTIGFPTVNLDPSVVGHDITQGIYASKVEYKGKKYIGALYFGPRLVRGETLPVLEIHILDFDKEIYGEKVTFTIDIFLRPIANFASFEKMKTQLKKDIVEIQKNFIE